MSKALHIEKGEDGVVVATMDLPGSSMNILNEELAAPLRGLAELLEDQQAGVTGLIGHDEERGNELRAIEFPRIKGGKAFDTTQPWFKDLLKEIGQPMTATVHVAH